MDRMKVFSELLKTWQDDRKHNKLRDLYENVMTPEHFAACCRYETSPTGAPYPWQVEFHNASAEFPQRAIIASNRAGKSSTCGADIAIHATGLYPKWWTGRRYTSPINILIGSETNEMLRNVQQKALYGELMPEKNEPDGTGWIPKDCIVSVSMRQCGIAGVYDEVKVQHTSGGVSRINGKTYEQGWTTWQGSQGDVVWMDEEPKNPGEDKIFSEVVRGLLDRNGMLVFSRTPLLGMTKIVKHFIQGKSKFTYYKNVTMDEAPHLSEEKKQEFMDSVPEYEWDARLNGIPLLGEGVIYPVSDEFISYEPFSIPKYFRRLVGLDFGDNHPTAACWGAYDADTDVVYIYDVYRQRRQTIATHAAAIRSRGPWIPVAWPHDGHKKDTTGSMKNIRDIYEGNYLNMLPESSRYDDKVGGGQAREPIIQECFERMVSGRLKVAKHLGLWFEEKRMYHRKDGRVVDVGDDILSAMHYMVMMIRYARTDMVQQRQTVADMQPSIGHYSSM